MLDPAAVAFYRNKLKKTGVALTLAQLRQQLDRLKIKTDRTELAQWLAREKLTARFSRVARPKAYQTIGVLRPGVYFMDYAEYQKSWGWHNKGCTGFLLAVENVTNRLFVHPCKTKETASWEEAIEKFIELTRNVTTIFSDRDTVVTSRNFRARVMDKYNVNWYFLKKGSKAYLAERYIGFVKTKLSQALESRDEEGDGEAAVEEDCEAEEVPGLLGAGLGVDGELVADGAEAPPGVCDFGSVGASELVDEGDEVGEVE